MKIETKQ
jgi:flagellar hook-basal body complex protein FliE